jgi:hypothetical protein
VPSWLLLSMLAVGVAAADKLCTEKHRCSTGGSQTPANTQEQLRM